jgi:hypothetical protein
VNEKEDENHDPQTHINHQIASESLVCHLRLQWQHQAPFHSARDTLLKALLALTLCCTAFPVFADPPRIVGVEVTATNGLYDFSVTVSHPDTGWDDYADAWEVRTFEGQRLGLRTLFHPHVNEQPFTRSLNGVCIPRQITMVQLRAKDNLTGRGEAVSVALPDQNTTPTSC